ncbi:MAG: thioredoxin-like domain-containing protein [Balneolales bacterium]
MTKYHISFSSFVFLSILLFACNTEADGQSDFHTQVSGSFTAGEDYEAADNLSGYNLIIVNRATEPVDTLFRAVTNDSGAFEGIATFNRNGEYPILVEKDEEVIDAFTLVLADDDPVQIKAELPEISDTRTVNSFENDALHTYRRLDNQYYRIYNLVNAGAVDEEEIPKLMNTWADLFWSVREDYPNTVASDRATNKALETLDGWDDQKTLDMINSDLDDVNLQEAAIYYGTVARIRLEGLDSGISFLEELDERTHDEVNKRLIAMNEIELLYDSSRVDQARDVFNKYEHRFIDSQDSTWASSMEYELNNLAPGLSVPDFELETSEQGTISNYSLQGGPYLLEVAELSSRQYQRFHPTVNELVETYSEAGLKLITVPLEQSVITINAFYGERPKPWAVGTSGAYAEADLIEKFNINQLPLRILVDGDGKIVRKYLGTNLQQLESDIETLN